MTEKSVEHSLIEAKHFTINLIGNPNVGKSTLFNALTHLRQHTGNWAGKTVQLTSGFYQFGGNYYHLVDLPGTYSLSSISPEEKITCKALCQKTADCTIVVCDATMLERNFNLLLQTLEITNKVILCINLLDEAEKKQITIDLPAIANTLAIPVIGISARNKKGLTELLRTIESICLEQLIPHPPVLCYSAKTEKNITQLQNQLTQKLSSAHSLRWLALQLLSSDKNNRTALCQEWQISDDSLAELINVDQNQTKAISEEITATRLSRADDLCHHSIVYHDQQYHHRDRQLDKILISPLTGIPIMLLFLTIIFWLTITGANYPSSWLSCHLFAFGDKLFAFLINTNLPPKISEALIFGVYRVLAWVVSVMLPPMAIFFPLFTLLEDFGYLPRVAFNLDYCFHKACTCGKQSLTMCMGFGCNAAGVVGCRIIDSPRERMIAVLTNSFVPCNGRFPAMISVISMFFVSGISSQLQSVTAALILLAIVVWGVMMTFLFSRLLSKTILKGEPSSFALELPPYRRPQFISVIIRSIFDRTLFVLLRAILIAAPAGLLIWCLANINFHEQTLIAYLTTFLDPVAQIIGLDGVILLAFILGFPANEIVIPLMLMIYLSGNNLIAIEDLSVLKTLLVDNGWTWVTAICFLLFSLMHWPCSTTCLTIKKETGSWKWVGWAILLPFLSGFLCCFLFAQSMRLLGLA